MRREPTTQELQNKAREIVEYISGKENLTGLLKRNDRDHSIEKHEVKPLRDLVERLELEDTTPYASTINIENMANYVGVDIKLHAEEIARWILSPKRTSDDFKLGISCNFANPVGHAAGQDRKYYECRSFTTRLVSDKKPPGFHVVSAYPDIVQAKLYEKDYPDMAKQNPFYCQTGLVVSRESELAADNLKPDPVVRIYSGLNAKHRGLRLEHLRDKDGLWIPYIDISVKGKDFTGKIIVQNDLYMDYQKYNGKKECNEPTTYKTLIKYAPKSEQLINALRGEIDLVKHPTMGYDKVEIISDEEAEGKVTYGDKTNPVVNVKGLPQNSRVQVNFMNEKEVRDGYIRQVNRNRSGAMHQEYEFVDCETGFRTTIDPNTVGKTLEIEAYERSETVEPEDPSAPPGGGSEPPVQVQENTKPTQAHTNNDFSL